MSGELFWDARGEEKFAKNIIKYYSPKWSGSIYIFITLNQEQNYPHRKVSLDDEGWTWEEVCSSCFVKDEKSTNSWVLVLPGHERTTTKWKGDVIKHQILQSHPQYLKKTTKMLAFVLKSLAQWW